MGEKNDVNVLLPQPCVFRVGGEELRLQALPVKKLLGVVQYVQDNADLLDKLSDIGDSKDGKKVDVVGFLTTEVCGRANGLLRLLFDKATTDKLTDEWCADHLSTAHYVAIVRKAIEQNQLDGLFRWAGGFLGQRMETVLRRGVNQEPEKDSPAS